ncbi:MAG: hypothetical protein H0T43_03495 [Solirubrobacterales bacterium]|nr:hypothetical protein [Solirubrobacterales bacterium]
MRAVNLIPSDGPHRGGGERASGGTYVLLGALAVAVAIVAVWTMTGKQVSDREAELARVEREAVTAEARVATLGPYTRFAALSRNRAETVSRIAGGRFDWAHALREVARVVPEEADLVSLTASAAPGGAQGGEAGPLRAALPVPAFDIVGCTSSQSRVAKLLARLRAIDGVQRVSLSSSEKADQASGTAETDCRTTEGRPQFQMTIFFRALPGAVGAPVAPGAPVTPGAPAAPVPAAGGGTP